MVWFTALSTHLVGYFEGIGSERGLGWWCSDSLSPRDFPRLETGKLVRHINPHFPNDHTFN